MAQQVFLKDLRAEFSCHVCLDLLTDPVTLDCGHHCCASCLQHRWQDRLDILPCPVCQHHCAYRNLQKNSQLSTLVDMVKQLPSSGRKRKQEQEQPLCEQHQQVLSLFCEQDLQLVCVQCRVFCEQQGHPVTPTEEPAFHHRKKLKSHLQTLSRQLEGAHQGLEMQNRSSVEGRGSKMAAAMVECHKLKLEELKQECLARGLETKGKNQDVSNRLLAYLEEHGEEEANEEVVLGDETEDEEPKPVDLPVQEEEEEKSSEKTVNMTAEKKVIKLTSKMSQAERMQKRAERFNVPVSLESKKAARAARFGISSVSKKGLSHDTKPMVNLDKLRQRAQRFGLNVSSSIYRMSEGDEKLQKRKERFGIVTNFAGTGTKEDTGVKKRQRAQRFGMAW